MAQQLFDHDRAVAGNPATGIVPAVGKDHRLAACFPRDGEHVLGLHVRRHPGTAEFNEFATNPRRQRLGLGGVAVRVHQDLVADIRHICRRETVTEGDGQDSVRALHGLYPVDERAALRMAGHERVIERAAVEQG